MEESDDLQVMMLCVSFSLTKMEKEVGLYQIRVSNSGRLKGEKVDDGKLA